MPMLRSPTRSDVAPNQSENEAEDTFVVPPQESINQDLINNQESQDQVSNQFDKRLEDMQVLFLNQIKSIQSMMQVNNTQTQNSITALRENLRLVETNVARFSQHTPLDASVSNSIICPSNSTVATHINQVVSSSYSYSTANMAGASIASNSNAHPFDSIPSVSTFANLQPIAHTSFPTEPNLLPSVIHNRQKKIYPLPKFSGSPEDWLTFYESFTSSTLEFEYSDLHNIMRLRDSLEGVARESVESLLVSSKNVNAIIETLSQMFGRPEQLIKSQIQKVRSLPSVKESDLISLINFANKIGNMATFLESVGGDYHLSNPLLLSELLAKLPVSKRLQWAEKCLTFNSAPTISDFSKWLSDLRKISNMVTDALPLTETNRENRKYSFVVRDKKCKLCENDCKSLALCKTFLDLPVASKWQTVKSLKACFCCLKFGHHINNCFFKKKCEKNDCGKMHHNILHDDLPSQKTNLKEKELSSDEQPGRSCLVDVDSDGVLFQFIPVKLYGPNGSENIYAFVDDGANVSIIDYDVVRKLGISGQKDTLELQWINQQISYEKTQKIDIEISSLKHNCRRYNMKNVYVSKYLDLPRQSLNTSIYNFTDTNLSIDFANLNYHQIKPKMIISLAHAFLTVPLKTPQLLSPSGLIATETNLGWLIYGNLSSNTDKVGSYSCHAKKPNRFFDNKMDVLMKNYFGIETFGIRHCEPLTSLEDKRAMEILNSTTKRVGNRFEAGLLWREDFKSFPNSYKMAFKRLNIVEKKMASDPSYAEEYCNKIEEYVEKGYARILSEEEASIKSNKTFYLPHFGVKNPNKKKLRFVFDAAAEIDNVSLNKVLLSGPDLNQPLQMILFKFRQAPIAICGDLKEMFHQISITKEDQDALRFLWRKGNSSESPRTYVMQRMIFGAACSPTTAQFVKNRNAKDFEEMYPQAAKSIIEKHYVDDYVDCFDTEQEAISVVKAVNEIHNSGGFQMHNLITNSKIVAQQLEISNQSEIELNSDKIDRILGMNWISNTDNFVFALHFHKVPKSILELKIIPTKRQLLSITMSVFDPFGFIADFMIVVKILMQEVWRCGIEWDSKLPENVYEKFKLWLQELPKISEYKISRYYFKEFGPQNNFNDIELHLFCDASEEALAAVGYWRITKNSISHLVFITGKTACAPLRYHSIPKLELQAAVMAVRLKEAIVKCHDRVKPRKVIFWTDSHTVIRWIRSDHRKYKQYVANRVSEILENSEICNWRWCPTLQNPADVGTRAKFPLKYNPEGRWKKGPDFLSSGEDKWPEESDMGKQDDKSMEYLKTNHFAMATQDLNIIDIIMNRSSKHLKVLRVVSWILRFYKNIKLKIESSSKIEGELTVDELSNAENKIIRNIQIKHYSNEYKKLILKENIDISSNIRFLNPFIDELGLLRVGGRLENADVLSEFAKHQIILPKKEKFSQLLVEHYHIKNCHQNTNNVMGGVRQKYWIPSLRSLVRSIESNCNFCKIRRAAPIQPQMGILPVDRVTPFVKPFSYTGVDLFGPFNVKIRRYHEKRWVALFTCLTIRAVHIEIVSDLSTDTFLLSLKNFVNRRGVPIQIRSDNGRNFVGINKELKNELFFMDRNELICKSTPLGIKWIFNTPYDPSAGGAWERLIQSVKKSLSVLMGNITPRLDVFNSFLIECENIVNSRPLTHIPVSPYEPEPITPNHFLIGNTNSTQTPSNFEPKLICLRKQWQVLQNLKNGFWTRWIREYLPELTRRVKWCLPREVLQVGGLVLICDTCEPRSKWRRGRVVEVHTDKHGTARSASVKTCDGILKRPVSKLAVLDIVNM